jgi:hypothetical protein
MTSTTRFTSTLVAAAFAAATAPLLAQRVPATSPTNLPPEVLSLACAPTLTYEAPVVNARVTGGQDSSVRRIHAPGDLVVLNKGSEDGLKVGQEFFVRRVYTPGQSRISREEPATVRTAGWIKVYAVDPKMALATVAYACDSIEIDDYLEPFVMPQVPVASTSRNKPDKTNYAHVLSGADRRRSFGKGDYFVLDRGSDQGIRPGAQFVVYRNKHERNVQQPDVFLYELGEAVAVDVKNDRATLLVTMSRDAFTEGDLVAMRPE